MDQGSTMKRSAVHNFAPTVTKFCVMWEGQALPHDTKFGNSRCEIVGRRVIFIWSLIHGLRWSGLIKAEPGPVRGQAIYRHSVDYLTEFCSINISACTCTLVNIEVPVSYTCGGPHCARGCPVAIWSQAIHRHSADHRTRYCPVSCHAIYRHCNDHPVGYCLVQYVSVYTRKLSIVQ